MINNFPLYTLNSPNPYCKILKPNNTHNPTMDSLELAERNCPDLPNFLRVLRKSYTKYSLLSLGRTPGDRPESSIQLVTWM